MTGSGLRPLDLRCSEQSKLALPKHSSLPKRDINMSEQKQSSFMQELDQWTESTIIGPLFASEADGKTGNPPSSGSKKAIRQKVLESYRTTKRRAAPASSGAEESFPAMSWGEGRGNLALLFFCSPDKSVKGGRMHSNGISPAS